MTEARAAQVERTRKSEERGRVVRAEAREKVEELSEKEKEIRRKARQLELKQERTQKLEEAVAALMAQDYESAYQTATELLEADASPPEEETDENTDGDPTPGAKTPHVRPPPLTDKEKARLHFIIGTVDYRLGREAQAIESYRRAVELDPGLRPGRRNLGKLLYNEHRYQEALDAWKLELADGFRDADILYLVGRALYETGKKEAAREAMRSVIVERPSDEDLRRWLAWLNLETGRYEEAARVYREIVEDKPMDPEYRELLGNAYIKNGEYEKAVDAFEVAASIELAAGKRPSKLLKTLGDLYAYLQIPDLAADRLAQAHGGRVEAVPGGKRYKIGMLYADAERLSEAARWLGKVPENHASYAEAQARLACLYRSLGDVDKALRAFETVRRARPQDCLAHLAAGDIYLEGKDLAKALDAYSQASGLDDCRADALAGLAEVAYTRGDLEQAASYYREASEERPGEARFTAALEEIETELRYRKETEQIEATAG